MTDVAGALALLMQRLAATEAQWRAEKARAEKAEDELRVALNMVDLALNQRDENAAEVARLYAEGDTDLEHALNVVCAKLFDLERRSNLVQCAYCGTESEAGADMQAHAEQCAEHPMSDLRAEVGRLRADLAEALACDRAARAEVAALKAQHIKDRRADAACVIAANLCEKAAQESAYEARAALAASQAREARLREALAVIADSSEEDGSIYAIARAALAEVEP